MFIVLLKFSDNRDRASDYMDGHNAWLTRGFEDGVFLLAGSLQPGQGGSVIAFNTSLAELEHRVGSDPYVAEKVVTAEIMEIDPKKADERLSFLMA